MNLLEKAWVIPNENELNDREACRVAFYHPTCHYGQPVLVAADGRAFGPGDIKAATCQHLGEHKAALAAAGYVVVENLEALFGPPIVE